MGVRPIPYSYVCSACGAEDQATNARGPVPSRCRACRWGRQVRYSLQSAAQSNPFRPRQVAQPRPIPCEGCGVDMPPTAGAGRPRRFCFTCRPQRETAPEAIAKAQATRQAWKAEHALEPRPLKRGL